MLSSIFLSGCSKKHIPEPTPPDTKLVSEEISVAVLDEFGEPTGEVMNQIVNKRIQCEIMLIDQELSANDLTITNCLETGIPLRECNINIGSEDIDVTSYSARDVNAQIAQARSKFVESHADVTPEDKTPETNNNE